MNRYRLFLAAGLMALLGAAGAHAQQAAPVQQSASRLDAAQGFTFAAGTINQAQATATIPALSGQCIYVDSLVLTVGNNATAATAVPNWTTTNLGGLSMAFYLTTNTTGYFSQQMVGAAPIKSAQCGTAVTIVSPSQLANSAYPFAALYHYAP